MGSLSVPVIQNPQYIPYLLPNINYQKQKNIKLENVEVIESAQNLNTKFHVRKPRTGKFHWTSLRSPRADSQDDGVVLLVGLFNLLAIIVYTAQKFLTNELVHEDTRLINWQVQKVLDELVLRVHSSDTTANLLSRALKTGRRSRLLGSKSSQSLGSKIFEKLSHEDPDILNKWVTGIRRNLIREISKSKSIVTAPGIAKQMYYPLINLYKKVTETKKVGRVFSSSLLQEVGGVANVLSNLGLQGTQDLLATITKLGILKRNNRMSSETILNLLSIMTQGTAVPTEVTRLRRSTRSWPGETKTMKKTGIAEEVPIENGNWADGWFSLITMVAPIGLDMTVVYSKARDHPKCLTAYMCQSNSNWKHKGPVHATITPFLSVLTSWALEEKSEKSLGDSLIAIRAGWLGKKCSSLYPECLLSPKLHPVAQTAEDFHIRAQKPTTHPGSLIDRSDSGDIVYVDTSEGSPIDEDLQSRAEAAPEEQETPNDDATDIMNVKEDYITEQLADDPQENLPFERYDNPDANNNNNILNSDNVSGMDLQDRPNMHREDHGKSEAITYPPTSMTRRVDHRFMHENSEETQNSPADQGKERVNHDFKTPKTEKNANPYQHIPVNRGLSYFEKPRADRQRQSHQFYPHHHHPPAILTNEQYSYYMASQAPPRNRPKKPQLLKPTHRKEENSDQQSSKKKKFRLSKYHKNFKHHKNHQYESRSRAPQRLGLMRGLPAKQVEGHSPVVLGWSAEELPVRPSPLMSQHDSVTAAFQPEDAVTDAQMHQRLYQYIRDQQSYRNRH